MKVSAAVPRADAGDGAARRGRCMKGSVPVSRNGGAAAVATWFRCRLSAAAAVLRWFDRVAPAVVCAAADAAANRRGAGESRAWLVLPLRCGGLGAVASPCRHVPGATALVAAAVGRRNGDADQLLDVAQEGALLRVAERDRDAVGAGARGAADAVHVALGHVRQVVVDDVGDAVDVDAAGGDVGRDQDADACRRGRPRARARAGSATCCRGSPRPAMPALARSRTTLSAPCLVRVKTSARSTGSCPQHVGEQRRLVGASTMHHALVDALDRGWRAASRRPGPGRAACCGELGDLRRHRRREEQGLALVRQLPTIFRTSWMKPMSSMRSASSSTKISTRSSRTASPAASGRAAGRGWRRGCRRRARERGTCGRSATPPKTSAHARAQVRP